MGDKEPIRIVKTKWRWLSPRCIYSKVLIFEDQNSGNRWHMRAGEIHQVAVTHQIQSIFCPGTVIECIKQLSYITIETRTRVLLNISQHVHY